MKLCLTFLNPVSAITKVTISFTLLSWKMFVVRSSTIIPDPPRTNIRSNFRCNLQPSNMSTELLSLLALKLMVCGHGLSTRCWCLILISPSLILQAFKSRTAVKPPMRATDPFTLLELVPRRWAWVGVAPLWPCIQQLQFNWTHTDSTIPQLCHPMMHSECAQCLCLFCCLDELYGSVSHCNRWYARGEWQ